MILEGENPVKSVNPTKKMNETGIGYAGIEGTWWLPAVEPFRLSSANQQELNRIGPALFAFSDVITRLYKDECAPLVQLLEHKVPPSLRAYVSPDRMDTFRPDFQLEPAGKGTYHLVLTEIESCPAAQGFAHAMQVGYGLETDLVDSFTRYLDGRPLLITGTQQWSQFIFDQLAFCRALAGQQASGQVLFDSSVARIAAGVRLGHLWQPPLFGIPDQPSEWDNAVGARIYRNGLLPYLWPDDTGWPEDVGESVVFRFGYVDYFEPAKLNSFRHWSEQGAIFMNPPNYFLDNKVLLAALRLPELRQELDQEELDILDHCVPETHLLNSEIEAQLLAEKKDWVLKFAGFDSGNGSWGGKSVVVGRLVSSAKWQAAVEANLNHSWPVIAQRYTHTAHTDIDYFTPDGQVKTLSDGRTRLRAFYLRDEPAASGVHLTISGQGPIVAESVQAVQTPVTFG